MSPTQRGPLTVVVPTRDRPEMLRRCLDSVRAALRPGDQLIVVDSASRDRVQVAAVATAAGATVLRCDRPGVNRARNAGWRQGTHELVLFTDDDVVVDAAWADAFADACRAHPDVAFVTGWIGVPPGQDPGLQVAVKDDSQPAVLDRDSRGILGHSASLAVRRSVLERVGGFDEALGAGGKFRSAPELDLFDRIFATGAVGRFEPTARAWHDQWRGSEELVRLHWSYGFGTGARLAKLARTDRPRMRQVAVQALGEWGVADLATQLVNRRWRSVVASIVRMAGYLSGFLRARQVPVRDGHFAPPEG